jgi:hypothetical protein
LALKASFALLKIKQKFFSLKNKEKREANYDSYFSLCDEENTVHNWRM